MQDLLMSAATTPYASKGFYSLHTPGHFATYHMCTCLAVAQVHVALLAAV